MKNKFIWLGLSFLMVAAMLLASCATSTTTSTPTSTTTSMPTSTTTSMPTSTTSTTTNSTAVPTTTTATTTTATGNWWDSLGTPQYGGTMTIRTNKDIINFDLYYSRTVNNIVSAWEGEIICRPVDIKPVSVQLPNAVYS